MVTYSGRQAKVAVDVDNGVAYTDSLTTDQVQSVSFDFDGGLEEIYHMGSRDPQEIKEGNKAISGTIERYFGTENFSASGMAFSEMAIAATLTEFWVALFPEGDEAPKILISNVKFGGYSTGVDQGGIMTESVTFKGLAIAVS